MGAQVMAAADGLDRWTQTMQAICGRFETTPAHNRALFIGEVSTFSRAGLHLANMRTNAASIRREGGSADQGSDEHCFLVSQRSGYSRISQHGVDIELAPGDMLLMDSVGDCEIAPFGLIEHASLTLPRSDVSQALNSSAPFGKVSSTRACGRMLHVMMDQLCKDAESAEQRDESDCLRSAFVSLLGSGLTLGGSEAQLAGSVSAQHLRGYAQKVIDESLGQPGLTPISLANRLNISVRHLYRLFEEQGDSVCRYIQRARLARSADDLSNPFLKTESITTIAFKWGFTDSAHFSRSFKKQFEQSPKDYRASRL